MLNNKVPTFLSRRVDQASSKPQDIPATMGAIESRSQTVEAHHGWPPISIRIDRCDLYLDEYQRSRYFKVVGVEVVVADWEIDL
jgi:hypothetical protein